MFPTLLNIYGPLAINMYGLMIFIAVIVFTWLLSKDKNIRKFLSLDQISNIVILGIISGVFGSKILYNLTDQEPLNILKIIKFWEGGGSILGGITLILVIIPIYLKSIKAPVLKTMDQISIYTPLLESISRLGCWFAGCCHGTETTFCLAIKYTHPDSYAPQGIYLHPTQIYASLSLFLVFLIMLKLSKFLSKPGELISCYIILTSLQRFLIDFLRGDREYFSLESINFLSIHQWIALGLITIASAMLLISAKRNK
ncbi:MAG: Lgt: prolipoprotein diacylglycyeryl transferase [candidate division TM6 bacterium GW2011_GWF2_32_72]|nr:MAG: Lgt: prolipoprotein diacylglycyeryl transferase [candidate division TM6 bacterium GW2011_GWF2_32_72]